MQLDSFTLDRKIIRSERRGKAIDLLGGECVKCGSTNFLQFDHIKNDREHTKDMLAYVSGCNWDRILQEIKKCQLLCRSCHTRKSNVEKGYNYQRQHGTRSMYMKPCRCDACRAAANRYNKERLARLWNQM